MSDYLSYNEVLSTAKKQHRCCECRAQIAKRSLFWILTCSEQGKEPILFSTCEACHAQRTEFCTEYFTPSQLMQDLETLRSDISYDNARGWALITNAISLLRQRRASAMPVPRIPTTPTPLRGVRAVHGGFAP